MLKCDIGTLYIHIGSYATELTGSQSNSFLLFQFKPARHKNHCIWKRKHRVWRLLEAYVSYSIARPLEGLDFLTNGIPVTIRTPNHFNIDQSWQCWIRGDLLSYPAMVNEMIVPFDRLNHVDISVSSKWRNGIKTRGKFVQRFCFPSSSFFHFSRTMGRSGDEKRNILLGWPL